jgi:predicted RecB family nuclease
VNLFKEGKDFRKERGAAADLGTLLHSVVEDYPKVPTEEVYRADYPRAKAVFENHSRWMNDTKAEIVLAEVNMVSEKLRFGGCPDMVFKIPGSGDLYLGDTKTGSSWGGGKTTCQMAAYAFLLAEHGVPVKSAMIHHHTKDHKLRLIELGQDVLAPAFEIFKMALELDKLIPQVDVRTQGRLA